MTIKWTQVSVILCCLSVHAAPAAACVQDVGPGGADAGSTSIHPAFAVCLPGVACGRCGSCNDCAECTADPKGKACIPGDNCGYTGGYSLPFSPCFADPAYSSDAVDSAGLDADGASPVVAPEASGDASAGDARGSAGCSAGGRGTSAGAALGLWVALGAVWARRAARG